MNVREIVKWLNQFGIEAEELAWRNGLLSIDGSIIADRIEDLPFKFGLINGHFKVADYPRNSLENCPDEVKGDFSMKNCPISTLEGGPKIVKGFYHIDSPTLSSLKGAPTYMGWAWINGGNLMPYECRYLLLTTINPKAPLAPGSSPIVISSAEVASKRKAVEKILLDDRVDGIMPSELIPSKIRQLRELSDG